MSDSPCVSFVTSPQRSTSPQRKQGLRIALACAAGWLIVIAPLAAQPPKTTPGNRLAYLDELDPYYPHAKFPKLITPQWIGEDGVEAVVILAIDDMREPAKYETFLRPILRRLQKIDGRAPVSIMTCSVNPKDPQLQTWLKEGLSLECHTIDHPCPFFKPGFEKAKSTYDRCVDLMNEIPGNKPVAFRMPCCDSLNTPSPRHWAEIFNKTTPPSPLGGEGPGVRVKGGKFLSIDSSVFMYYTSDDPGLPKNLTLDADGKERFKRYLPMDRSFVNTIENYPYPYVIGNFCWQFPCMTPSDWQAQHLQKPNNPKTVEDWKAALDCTVIKQGVMTMVFHPHGWIRNDQMVELIDYAVTKHGKKVKFLTFKEALERLNKHALGGYPLRRARNGGDNGVRMLDLDNDGYIDRVTSHNDEDNESVGEMRLWGSKARTWRAVDFVGAPIDWGVRFGVFSRKGNPWVFSRFSLKALVPNTEVGGLSMSIFNGEEWIDRSVEGLPDEKHPNLKAAENWTNLDPAFRLLDLDGDGRCEWIVGYPNQRWIFTRNPDRKRPLGHLETPWKKLSFALPNGVTLADAQGRDAGLRFLDLNADGKLDIIFSNEKEYGIYLFTDMEKGWSKKILHGKRGEPGASATGAGVAAAAATGAAPDELPMISRHGQNNGFWVHSGYLWWSNEDTVLLKDHVDRRKIADLLKGVK